MANPLLTPNMFLTEPAIGSTVSPTWAQDLNSNFGILDQHNHEPGSGVQIPPGGLNISSDLTFQGNNATNLRSTRYTPISLGSITGTDLDAIVVDTAGDLYYINGAGLQIQITNSSGIVGTPGSISGLVSPASASYVSGTGTFVWQQASGVAANMDAATYILRYPSAGYPTPSGNYIALQAPSTLATGFALTFPATLPGSTSLMQLGASGQISASNSVSGNVLVSGYVSAGTLVYPSGVSNAALIADNANTLGVYDPGTATNYSIVTSAAGNTTGLLIVRGIVNSNGTIFDGEGFTISAHSTGQYTINFNVAFADTPAVTATCVGSNIATLNTILTTEVIVNTTGFANVTNPFTVQNAAFHFIAIGQRNG